VTGALAAAIGLAEGLAVGTAFVSFLVALEIVPRLARLTGTEAWSPAYEAAVVLGALAAALDEARPLALGAPPALVVPVAAAMGAFVGMAAAALAEVVGVLPVLSRRLGLGAWLGWLILALVAGKTAGAVLWWAVPSLWSRPPA
jgi:stage V sporulation protein AB